MSPCGPTEIKKERHAPLWVAICAVLIARETLVPRPVVCNHRSRQARVYADLKQILTVANTLYTTSGKFPQTIEEMVNAKDENGNPALAYLESMPKDPWGHEYVYSIQGDRPRVICLGSGGLEGGEGEVADAVLPAPGPPVSKAANSPEIPARK